MRRFALSALAAALVMGTCVAPALAAGPDHLTISGTDVDPDFCGTGQTVHVAFRGVFNEWDDQAFGHIRTTFTNPANGVAVYDSFSGGGKVTFIDDGGGAFTIATTREGQPFRVQYVNGPLILQDAGLIISHDHFDADGNYLGTDVVVVNGPHPGFETDWCALMIDVLEL